MKFRRGQKQPKEMFAIQIDRSKFTPELLALMQAAKDSNDLTNDINALCLGLSSVITACPPEWGRADDPETYMNLSFYQELIPLCGQVEAMRRKLG